MKHTISVALEKILEELSFPKTNIVVQIPNNQKNGDFSTNLALQLARDLGKDAKQIAQSISQKLLKKNPDLIQTVQTAGPGFINIWLQTAHFTSQLKTVLDTSSNFGSTTIGAGKRAQIEFVSANPTGPLTVGHGRGAILGDIISNILQWNGYDVEREYYYNNAGNQMVRLGKSVQTRYLELLGEKAEFSIDDGYEGDYIIDIAHKLIADKNKSLKSADGIDHFIRTAEKNIFSGIKNTLKKIDLNFDNFFNEQSLYKSGSIDLIINTLRKKQLIYEKDGATWFNAKKIGREKDKVLIKSSGEPTYRLPDIAYHKDKFERGYDLIVDVFGADHMDAYPDVLAVIEALGYDKNKVKVLIHQFVTLIKKGKPVKMSTRKAQYVTLNDLIDEVGADVVRYFFIMRGMNTHLNFDLDLAKDESDANPVYYLQYAHARLCNIINHAQSQGQHINKEASLEPLQLNTEMQLIKTVMEFPGIIDKAHTDLEPQAIANYLQNLSGQFHRYYAKERIVTQNQEQTSARLVLIRALQIVLHNGLMILGIKAPKKM